MKKEKKDKGYELIAEEGKELVVMTGKKEAARAKSVYIADEGTKNKWIEVDALPEPPAPEPPTQEELDARRIEELEAELARLKSK